MVKKTETFKEDLQRIKEFLSQKRKLTDLANECGVSTRTVHEAFSVESFEDLTGDKLKVYEAAIEMVDRITNLPMKAQSLLKA